MEYSVLDSGHYTTYTFLPLSPVGSASAVEATSSGLLSSEQQHKVLCQTVSTAVFTSENLL